MDDPNLSPVVALFELVVLAGAAYATYFIFRRANEALWMPAFQRQESRKQTVLDAWRDQKSQRSVDPTSDLQAVFQRIDSDKSGTIDRFELFAGIRLAFGARLEISQEQVDDLITENDEDGNGELDFAEFAAAVAKLKAKSASAPRLLSAAEAAFIVAMRS